MLPDYFFEVAASSTGKYHPAYATGSGGLVRHTKAAVKIAHELLSLEQYQAQFGDETIDCMLAALILHDGWKHGTDGSKYTVAEHPAVVADWIKNTPELKDLLDPGHLDMICSCLASHMGQWNTDYKTKREILPKPVTPTEQFVHLCDYLASRKYLTFEFDGDYYRPEDFMTDELHETITAIIVLCKRKVSEDSSIRDELYQLIAENNGGRKNPNSIQDIETAAKIYEIIKEK